MKGPGKLIAIEGSDSSGKETQSKLIYNILKEEGNNVKLVSFPDYNSESSSCVKMYLGGEFGTNASEVNIFGASICYSVDRFASFTKNWKTFYLNGGIIIADRYTISNVIHQASKIKDEKLRKDYIEWLYDMEFNKMDIPEPDLVLFLDMPPRMAEKLMADRVNKINETTKKDIHERNTEYLLNAYNLSKNIVNEMNWVNINCVDDFGCLYTKQEISTSIYNIIKNNHLLKE